MSPRNLTSSGGVFPKKRGRPSGVVDEEKISEFMHVIEYMENNDDESVTLDELHEIMEKEVGNGEVYNKRSLHRKLYAYYSSQV